MTRDSVFEILHNLWNSQKVQATDSFLEEHENDPVPEKIELGVLCKSLSDPELDLRLIKNLKQMKMEKEGQPTTDTSSTASSEKSSDSPKPLKPVKLRDSLSESVPLIKPEKIAKKSEKIEKKISEKEKENSHAASDEKTKEEGKKQENDSEKSVQARKSIKVPENQEKEIESTVKTPKVGGYKPQMLISAPPVINEKFEGISIHQFYERLVQNKSFWAFYFKKCENKEINVPDLSPSPQFSDSLFIREIKFIAPIKGAPIGPKQTRVVQSHSVSMPSSTFVFLFTFLFLFSLSLFLSLLFFLFLFSRSFPYFPFYPAPLFIPSSLLLPLPPSPFPGDSFLVYYYPFPSPSLSQLASSLSCPLFLIGGLGFFLPPILPSLFPFTSKWNFCPFQGTFLPFLVANHLIRSG